jgi:RecA/RadA recombinase
MLRDSAITQFGSKSIQSGADFLDSVHGVHIPNNIPLQYIFGVDVVPLERCLTIVGNWGSWKSAFGWYMVKLFIESGGLACFIDTEHKTNPDQVRSIIQNDAAFEERVIPMEVSSLEEMLGMLTHMSKHYIETADDSVPFLLFVDSMGGVTSEDAVKDMIKTGTVDTGFNAAHAANKVTMQFKGFVPTYLNGHNICLITVNHQKEKIDANRPSHLPPATTEAGGRGKDFAYTYNIQLKPVKDTSTKSFTRKVVRISTKKSSLSPVGMFIDVPITTYKAKPAEGIPMRTVFDWDAALVDLLTREKSTFLKEDMDAVCNVRSSSSTKASCTMLNVSPGTPVSPSEMGRMIHANADMVRGIQDALGILRKRVSFSKLEQAPVEEVTADGG